MLNSEELNTKFQTIEVPIPYKEIWKEVSLQTQIKKAKRNNLTHEETLASLRSLVKRPYFLCHLAGCLDAIRGHRLGSRVGEGVIKNFAEVGTAQGLQFYSFLQYLNTAVNPQVDNPGHAWTCDIIDVREPRYFDRHLSHLDSTFVLGDSLALAHSIKEAGKKIDFFYIDGCHKKGSVLRDVENLKSVQSEDPVWVFDDFDERFGCHHDINQMRGDVEQFVSYRVGDTASGNPNHQAIVFGKL